MRPGARQLERMQSLLQGLRTLDFGPHSSVSKDSIRHVVPHISPFFQAANAADSLTSSNAELRPDHGKGAAATASNLPPDPPFGASLMPARSSSLVRSASLDWQNFEFVPVWDNASLQQPRAQCPAGQTSEPVLNSHDSTALGVGAADSAGHGPFNGAGKLWAVVELPHSFGSCHAGQEQEDSAEQRSRPDSFAVPHIVPASCKRQSKVCITGSAHPASAEIDSLALLPLGKPVPYGSRYLGHF